MEPLHGSEYEPMPFDRRLQSEAEGRTIDIALRSFMRNRITGVTECRIEHRTVSALAPNTDLHDPIAARPHPGCVALQAKLSVIDVEFPSERLHIPDLQQI